MIQNFRKWLFRGTLVATIGFQAGCGTVDQSLVTGTKRNYAYTWAQEVELGKQSDAEIIAEYGLYNDTKLTNYVNQLGQKVLSFSHARRPETPEEIRKTTFTFRVLDSPIVNAFALPGGYIYVTRGLLAHVDNEAQLAVVLGHEIGHVIARHTSIQMGRQQRSQIYGILGVVVGAALGLPADMLEAGSKVLSTGISLKLLQYGRDAERESDALGVEYAAMAGYKVGEASRFFTSLKRIQASEGASIPSFMSSHPDPGERENTMLRLDQEYAAKMPLTKVNQSEYLALLDGLTVGENPRQGFVENNMFYHPDMKFQFPVPQNWQLQNGAAQVTMGLPNQAIMTFGGAQGKTAREAGATFSAQQGLQVAASGATTINGFNAFVVEAQTVAQQQGQATYGMKAYFIEFNGSVLQFLGYTAANNLTTHKPTFDQIVSGFKTLQDTDKLGRKPSVLALQKVSRGGTFSAFVPARLSNKITAEGLAIMNQVQLTQAIAAGHQLKLVR